MNTARAGPGCDGGQPTACGRLPVGHSSSPDPSAMKSLEEVLTGLEEQVGRVSTYPCIRACAHAGAHCLPTHAHARRRSTQTCFRRRAMAWMRGRPRWEQRLSLHACLHACIYMHAHARSPAGRARPSVPLHRVHHRCLPTHTRTHTCTHTRAGAPRPVQGPDVLCAAAGGGQP